ARLIVWSFVCLWRPAIIEIKPVESGVGLERGRRASPPFPLSSLSLSLSLFHSLSLSLSFMLCSFFPSFKALPASLEATRTATHRSLLGGCTGFMRAHAD